ncbi:ABC transporter protein [Pleomassaria siparia CBS 279.74]|uniref:ABC transporter protein n=1 Tax=Pleomassaria siparia CBS 279.74 TaxID=1314801 RepID=A0A6G1KC39_9PLEO|nr:ABC transporter protein [Pleomassaria siparia CBS 279.74]
MDGPPVTQLERWLSTKKQQALPSPSVCFDNLNVDGFTESTFFQHTFASYALLLPTQLMKLVGLRKQTKVPILRSLHGHVSEGEMLLVLGRPGSGCTTFLKTVAGHAHGVEVNESSINYSGNATWIRAPKPLARTLSNQCLPGIPYRELHRKCPDDAIYLSEEDMHLPELKLGDTLSFAASMRPDGIPPNDTGTRAACIFGLEGALQDPIGNDLIRGLSGGEKKRTSIAEAFITNSRIQCWDNSTRGLDSATALSVISTLRASADALRSIVMMSIYQASEAMYSQFDKVLVLYEGRQIYFGPAAQASQYFTELGFERPPRGTTPDFLTSMNSPAERVARKGFENRVPRTPDEFANAWRNSTNYLTQTHIINGFNTTFPITKGLSEQRLRRRHSVPDKEKLPSSIYPTSTIHQVNACIRRAIQRLQSNLVPVISGIMGNTIVAVILGSVFFNLPENTASFQNRSVLLFYSIMVNSCTPAFEVLTMWAQRPIVEKHSRYVFYHPIAEGIASMVADLPNKVITSLFFNVSLYFIANLRQSASAFFIFWLFAFVAMLTMSMIFRMVGSLSRTYEQSMAPVAIMIFNFIIYAGFVIPPSYQVPWLGWIRWINPIGYAYESLMINEFRNRTFPCSTTIPAGPEYDRYGQEDKICATIGAVPGQDFVQGNEFLRLKYGYTLNHLWRNLGLLFVLMAVFCTVHLVAAEYILAQRSKGDVLLFRKGHASLKPTDEEEGEKQAVHTGDGKTVTIESEQEQAVYSGLKQSSSVFHWRNVSYEVKVDKKNSRVLLDDITGWVQPGTLTALMGATGAGKTTLLDVLADRKSVGIVRGDMCINNQQRDHGFQRRTGYVQQADLHLPTATVREALEFSALLRQVEGTTEQKLAYVDTVLSMLDMQAYADAIVGVPGKGLNIEQRKRLTIAVEMAAKPAFLLFLDEPTSGLDSQTAWSICKLLRKLADNGQAIMCTIHQPSAQLFQIFDRVLLLGKAKTLYFGDIGDSSATLIDYFERHGARAYKEGENPAEWLLEVTSSSTTDQSWSDTWKSSKEFTAANDWLSTLADTESPSMGSLPIEQGRDEYAATFFQQLIRVTYRAFQDYWRDPTYLYSKLALCIGAALFNGLSFWLTPNDIQGITNVLFSCFLLTIIFSTVDQQIIPRFMENRALFEAREKQSKTYSWVVFVAANLIVEIVWQSLAAVFVFVAWYYPTGLWRNGDPTFTASERGGLVFFLVWLFFVFIPTLSQALAAGMADAQTAVNVAQLLFSLALIFCGILVAPADLPHFWKFMYRVSPGTYLVNGLVIAGLANTDISCSSLELLSVRLPLSFAGDCGAYMESYLGVAGGYVEDTKASDICLYCPLTEANSFLLSRDVDVADGWRDAGIFAAYIVFNTVAVFGLYRLARVSKSKKE